MPSTDPHAPATEQYGVTGLSHMGIQVRNIERSLRFYRDVLGLKASDVRDVPAGNKGGRRVVYLRWDDRLGSSFLHLSEYVERPPLGEPARDGELGIDHVSLRVADVDQVVERATAGGETVIFESLIFDGPDYGQDGIDKIKTAKLQDPDGTYVQIDQLL